MGQRLTASPGRPWRTDLAQATDRFLEERLFEEDLRAMLSIMRRIGASG